MKLVAGLGAPSRVPLQGRSRASFERMLLAAAKLLVERGSDDFTIADVSKAGRVSIGSIYGRFDSKDDLIRAVQARALAAADVDMAQGLAKATARSRSLDELVSNLIDSLAEVLRKHADIFRPLMLRATYDEVIQTVGKRSYAETERQFRETILARADEIRHPDPERAVGSVFRIAYATLARYLGFGSSTTAAWEGDWKVLKEDLQLMSSAFLLHSHGARVGSAGMGADGMLPA